MKYTFIDDSGTFVIDNPHCHGIYFPLTDGNGRLLASISPNLAGDIKRDNGHFLTLPASIEDLRSNPLCRREFFVEIGRKTIRLSKPYRDRLEAGVLYHKVIKNTGELIFEVINFIPHNIPAEVMWVKVKNASAKPLTITPTSFLPLFGRSEKNLRDHRHVSSLLNRISLEKYGIVLTPTMVFDETGHALNKTHYFAFGYEGQKQAPQGQFPTLDYFFGEGDVFAPDAIESKVLPVTKYLRQFDGKEPCAAFRFSSRRLAPGTEQSYVLIFGIEEDSGKVAKTFAALDSPAKVSRALEETKRYWRRRLWNLTIDCKDPMYNGWLIWVKLQPTLRRLFGCSFLPHFDYGKGGRGWRDLWQDALALLLTEPDKAKALITESFKGVRLDGSNATIIAQDGSFIADRNRINRVWMDHGVWPFLSTRLYIDRTGDTAVLFKQQPYFRDRQLKRAQEIDAAFAQNDFLQRDSQGRPYRGSILEHLLVQHLVIFFNVGKHNIIRLENADWNDGFDMAAERGESVAFSFMYAQNLKSLCDVLERIRRKRKSVVILKDLLPLLDRLYDPIDYRSYQAKQRVLAQYFQKLTKVSGQKIAVPIEDLIGDLKAKYRHMFSWLGSHEWLREGFFNGYYDNLGKRVEGWRCGRMRMILASQVFAIMSGVASDRQVHSMWRSANTYLRDKRIGGFHLNTDFGCILSDLGRAFGFSYGDKENGAFFSHMNVMFAHALYSRRFIAEGFRVMDSIYRMAIHERAGLPPCLPEYFNSQGRGLYLYLTGSASWYIHTLVQEVLGIKFFLGDLVLEPKLLACQLGNHDITAHVRLHHTSVTVIYRLKARPRPAQPLSVQEVFCAGRKINSSPTRCLIPASELKSSSATILVLLG